MEPCLKVQGEDRHLRLPSERHMHAMEHARLHSHKHVGSFEWARFGRRRSWKWECLSSFSFFYWLVYLHFKYYLPSQFPLHNPPIPSLCLYKGAPPHSCPSALAFPYPGNLHWIEGLPSQRYPSRPSSATYPAGCVFSMSLFSCLKKYLLVCVWVFCLQVCICVPGYLRDQKKKWHPLGLEL